MPRTLIFDGGENGYGWEELPAGVTPAQAKVYHRAHNAYLNRGPFVPGFRHYNLDTTLRYGDFAPRAVDWTQSGKVGVNRSLYYGEGEDLYRLSNGSETSIVNVSGGVIVDIIAWDDGTNGRLLVSYGSTAFVRTVEDDGTPTASSDTKLGFMAAAGGDLYAQTDAGTYSTYKVSKMPGANNPRTAANWGTGNPVGSASYEITGMASLDVGVAVGKMEGLFIFDEREGKYRNHLPFLERNPHPDNGKGMQAVSGGVLYPVHDGTLWFSDGFVAFQMTPLQAKRAGRDTPMGRIISMAELGQTIYCALDAFYHKVQEDGTWPKVFLYDDSASSFTDDTASLTDNNRNTAGTDLSGFDDSNDLWYFGFSRPIAALHVVMSVAATTGSGSWAYSNKSSGFTGFTPHDTTPASATAARFGKDGIIATPGLLAGFDPNDDMGTVTVNGVSAYWLRFSPGAFSAGAKLAEVAVTPARANLSLEATDHSGFDNSSSIVHLLAGIRTDEGIVWHDRYALEMGAPAQFIALSATDIDEQDNGGLALVVGSRIVRKAIALNKFDDPLVALAPTLNNHAAGFPQSLLELPRFLLGDPEDSRPRIVTSFDIEGEYVQAADKVSMGMRFDRQQWQRVGTVGNLPSSLTVARGTSGYKLDCWIAMTDSNASDPGVPRIDRVYANWEYVDEVFGIHPQVDTPSDVEFE